MDVPEFIDSYSDDGIILKEARDCLLNADNGRRKGVRVYESAFCRWMISHIYSSYETMSVSWGDKFKDVDFLVARKLNKKKNITAEDAVNNIAAALWSFKVSVDRDILADFIAITLIRNSLTHSGWHGADQQFIESRGFPTDVRKLDENHWPRLLEIHEKLTSYLGFAMVGANFVRR